MRYYYLKNGRVSGPFDVERLRGAFGRGSIDADTPLAPASGPNSDPQSLTWQPLHKVLPELAVRPAPPNPSGSGVATVVAQAEPSAPVRHARMTSHPSVLEVDVVNIRMSFGSMVVFMVKWVLASIPAFVILVLIGAAVWVVGVRAIVALIRGL